MVRHEGEGERRDVEQISDRTEHARYKRAYAPKARGGYGGAAEFGLLDGQRALEALHPEAGASDIQLISGMPMDGPVMTALLR